MEVFDITNVIEAVITFIVTLVSAIVIPYVRKKYSNEQLSEFARWVEIGVAAAEQIYVSSATQEKKQYVIDFLSSKGVVYNELEVDAAIEAAVIKLHTELYGQTVKGGEGE